MKSIVLILGLSLSTLAHATDWVVYDTYKGLSPEQQPYVSTFSIDVDSIVREYETYTYHSKTIERYNGKHYETYNIEQANCVFNSRRYIKTTTYYYEKNKLVEKSVYPTENWHQLPTQPHICKGKTK